MAQTSLARIDRYLNTAPLVLCDAEQVGAFTLFFNRSSDMPCLSYARPSGPLPEDLTAGIDAVRAAFAGHGRTGRWEFLDETAPGLARALVAAGMPAPNREPLLVVPRDSFRPALPGPGVELRFLGPDDDLRAAARVQQQAFGLELADASLEWMRTILPRGGRVAAAFVEGRPVSVGAHNPIDGVTEIAGIGTLPGFRRSGFASVVSSLLIADAFDRGCKIVFLTAGSPEALRVYQKLGSQVIGTARSVLDEAPPPPPAG